MTEQAKQQLQEAMTKSEATREEFWSIYRDLKIPVGNARDTNAATAGAWEMYKAMKARKQNQQQKAST